MAILKNAIIAASVLASYTLAVPVAGIHKRDLVMQTQIVTDWVTVNQQATVWVDDSGKPVKTDIPTMSGAFSVQPTPSSSSSSAYVAPSSVYSAPAAPPASSAPAPVASSPSAAPTPTYSPAGFAAQSSPVPSPAMSSSAPAPAAPAPAPSSTQVLQKSGSGGPCEGPGSGCSGDITHWDGGLGACGWIVNTASDMEIALPVGLMGSQSNGNPYCGRSLTIQGPSGNLVQATVGDKCMGCSGDSIDLTDALFTAVAPSGNGRVSNIQWWFQD